MRRLKLLILITLILASCSRTYKVTTDSMSNTFNIGQVLELKKKASIERGDIVLFTKNSNSGKETWISRVVAISGDTLEIKDGNAIVNNKMAELPVNARLQYLINSSMPLDIKSFRENSLQQISENRYFAYLTMDEFDKVSKLQNVTKINRFVSNPGEFSKGIVKHDYADKWNTDNFGPLYVPSAGEKIKINQANSGLFNSLLPEMLPDSTVTIKENLYFLMGDNRSNAFDSRFIGLVPESSIIGYVDE